MIEITKTLLNTSMSSYGPITIHFLIKYYEIDRNEKKSSITKSKYKSILIQEIKRLTLQK